MDPIDEGGALAHEGGARARQVAQLALWPRRDEARTHQAVGQQLGDPLGILDVRLAPGHGLDVLGVEQPDLERTFEEVEDRLPELPSACEADVGTAALGQPVGEAQELAGGRAKRLRLGYTPASRIACQPTDDHGPLVQCTSMPAQQSNTISMTRSSGLAAGESRYPIRSWRPHHVQTYRRGEGAARTPLVSSISPTLSSPVGGEATTSGSWRCPGPPIQQAFSHPVTCRPLRCSPRAAYPIFIPAGERRAHDYYSGRPGVWHWQVPDSRRIAAGVRISANRAGALLSLGQQRHLAPTVARSGSAQWRGMNAWRSRATSSAQAWRLPSAARGVSWPNG